MQPSGQPSCAHAPSHRVEVAAAVISNARDGRFLLAQRPAGKVYAGYWEFPGGKVEPGEPPPRRSRASCTRNSASRSMRAYPWIIRDLRLCARRVRLQFFPGARLARRAARTRSAAVRVAAAVMRLDVAPLLPANGPMLRALRLPLDYAHHHAGEIGRCAIPGAARSARWRRACGWCRCAKRPCRRTELRRFAGEVVARSRARRRAGADQRGHRSWRGGRRRRRAPDRGAADAASTQRPRRALVRRILPRRRRTCAGARARVRISRCWARCSRHRATRHAPALGWDGFARLARDYAAAGLRARRHARRAIWSRRGAAARTASP